jgi:uncharacterized membrane protein SpoIIM required for sporulation
MTETAFIKKNGDTWTGLEDYNRRLLSGGLRRMSKDDIRTFAELFRLTGYHLAYANTHFPQSQSTLYLNRIVGVAHNHFYIRERSGWADVKRYFMQGFPSAVREAGKLTLLAAALFFLGLFFTAAYVASDPSRFYTIFPQGIGEGGGLDSWDHSLMSAVIMTNNISVAVTAFGLGIFAGIGTVFVLVYNGIIVGGLYGFLSVTGRDMLEFYSLILPHGVPELTAIFLCGACGLMLGRGILLPGEYSRRHALIYQAKKAAVLIPGIVVMLVIAGLIEGFFTHKLIFAGITAAGMGMYVIRR